MFTWFAGQWRRWGGAGRTFALAIVVAALLAAGLGTQAGEAQTCANCTVYARVNLNMRKGPNINDAIVQVVPGGAGVTRLSTDATNGYTQVTYRGVTGWVVNLGLLATPPTPVPPSTATATAAPTLAPPPPTAVPTPPVVTSDTRVALVGLNLRSGPSEDDAVIGIIPQGGMMTLTREGAEGGYVTVDYGGARGWVYADLIGVP
ncbi:MAG TPA: SH3 domain-containing protein [Thermomicrobiales bacterium]|nr:SH3 domain-containing protein [Thermomicrobiales bacterium]